MTLSLSLLVDQLRVVDPLFDTREFNRRGLRLLMRRVLGKRLWFIYSCGVCGLAITLVLAQLQLALTPALESAEGIQ